MHPDTLGPAPVLIHPVPRARGTVFLLHGQGADALANAKELALLAGAGWNAVGVDAPDHGRRYDPERDGRFSADSRAELARHLEVASAEFPAILDAAATAGLQGPYAVAGISLGAFTGWRVLTEPRIERGLLLLGSPALPGDPSPDPAPWMGCRVLAINAECDEVVPLEPTRAVVSAIGGGLDILEGSPHRVEELQWWESWGRGITWINDPGATLSS